MVTTTRKNKIQSLLITHLLQDGEINITLPDGVELSIGITQENQNGEIIKDKNYCWVSASRDGKETSLDSFNLGLKFVDENSIIMFDSSKDENGVMFKRLNVV